MENKELTNAYNGAASTGYKGSIQDFTKLISDNFGKKSCV